METSLTSSMMVAGDVRRSYKSMPAQKRRRTRRFCTNGDLWKPTRFVSRTVLLTSSKSSGC